MARMAEKLEVVMVELMWGRRVLLPPARPLLVVLQVEQLAVPLQVWLRLRFSDGQRLSGLLYQLPVAGHRQAGLFSVYLARSPYRMRRQS